MITVHTKDEDQNEIDYDDLKNILGVEKNNGVIALNADKTEKNLKN
ncbi:MAG: hypothetical protein U9R02_10980 [Thermodesulfobacteriota bacterium]|nr:hypothetical protein [Thermodesulfobacteriota bacterium]